MKIDENNETVPMRTMHYRNSRYMLGALDLVEGIAIVHDDINDAPRLSVNQKLMKRSLKYFEEAASLKQGDALLLLSYFYQKGFLPFKIEPDVRQNYRIPCRCHYGRACGCFAIRRTAQSFW